MKKNNLFALISNKLFGGHLEFRVRVFNVLAMAGIVVGLTAALTSMMTGSKVITVLANFGACLLALFLLIYSTITKKYQICYIVTIAIIFFGFFPVIFFIGGGYHSAMPFYFIFAIVFTIFMLDGKKALIIGVLELLVYCGLIVAAYFFSDAVTQLISEPVRVIDAVIGLSVVSAALGITMYIQIRLYRKQEQLLSEQKDVLEQASKTKTEFLANSSHEMRTPLTIISVNVQTVKNILEDLAVKDPDADKLLRNAQEEVMRLGRMVGGMLTLASMSESTDKRVVNFSALLQSGADALNLNLHMRGNTLETDVAPDLKVFGNADLLAQVVSNLMQNAGAHTENGAITLTAARDKSAITVTVRDTGTGISPELLPRVFERGVSTGGTGYGLFMCKTVVESHSGKIWIESEPGKGTTAAFMLPYYQGQFGDDAI